MKWSCLLVVAVSVSALSAQYEDYGDPGLDTGPYDMGASFDDAPSTGNDWSSLSWDIRSMWQSRYVTEGRRRVADSQFLISEVVGHFGPLNVGAWWAQAVTQTSYNRLDAFVDTSVKFGAGELTLGLRRVFYPTGKETNSWEADAGFDFNIHSWFTPFARSYYDFDTIGGGFFEGGIKAPFEMAGGAVKFEPFGLLGVDYGYLSGTSRPQINHLQFGAELRWDVRPNWQLFGNINHSFSLSLLDLRGEGDTTWGGTGFRVLF